MSRFATLLARFRGRLLGQRGHMAFRAAGAVFSVLLIVWAVPDRVLATLAFQPGDWAMLEIVLAGLLGVVLLWNAAVLFIPGADPSVIPDQLPIDAYSCRLLDSLNDAEKLNRELVPKTLFADNTVDLAAATRAQQKNNRRIVALVETVSDQIVGWSSVWPLRADVGKKIVSGTMSDEELSDDDLLARERNAAARYALILSFVLLPELMAERPALRPFLAMRLGRHLLRHIRSEFFRTSDDDLTLLAIGYSDEGIRLCRRIGLEATGNSVTYQNGQVKPVFARRFSRKQLDELFESFL